MCNVHVNICMYPCIYVWMCVYLCMYICLYVQMCMFIYECMYVSEQWQWSGYASIRAGEVHEHQVRLHANIARLAEKVTTGGL